MLKDNLVFYKRVILILCTSIDVHKKTSCLSTNLYNQVYFDSWY